MSPRNATTTGSKRYYSWRNEQYWSVTTILSGGVPKPALLPWGIKMVAEGAVDAIEKGYLPGMIEQDRDGAIKFLKGLPYAHRDAAADLGTYIHNATEAYALGRPFPTWPPLVKPRMDAYLKFIADHKPVYEATEASVYNRTQKYAGTLDAIVRIGDRRLILDTKSGKGVYPEVALQLAAYRYAEFIGLPDGSEEPMREVDGAVVLHLTDTGYELTEVDAGEDVFRFFLYCREVFRWQEERSKTVLIGPYPSTLDLAYPQTTEMEGVA